MNKLLDPLVRSTGLTLLLKMYLSLASNSYFIHLGTDIEHKRGKDHVDSIVESPHITDPVQISVRFSFMNELGTRERKADLESHVGKDALFNLSCCFKIFLSASLIFFYS